MDDKFTNFRLSINKMRQKVIEAKGGEKVQGLSEPAISKNELSAKQQTKTQEKN